MKSQKVVLFLLVSFLTVSVFARGKNDIETHEVENLNSWQEEFDLESKKPGKYNIMITAKDLGGNQYIEGPYNLYLDPDSDLPICGITNPYSNMRIVGNLNIVGTCVDDDGVDYVELVLDGDEEHPIRAEGAEFWSYYLDTVKLEEGPHTIKVTGYDINGLPGNPTNLTWQLDRLQPITTVLDRTMGMLVSGNVHFVGTVEDGNGIRELFYSVDNGENFIPVKISKNKDLCNFNITVDTKKFQDGPAVIWFKATDNAGSTGLYSFLYYIDNTKPDVQIVSPTPEQVVNGKFSITGFAKDTIGVTDLSWTFGEETGVFELIPGNPYWILDVDTLGVKEKSKKFTIRAVDKAGNVVEVSKNILLNQEEDKPIVQIAEPTPEELIPFDKKLYVRGFATDDDSVKSVKIQLDDNEAIIQETRGDFYYELCSGADLSMGNHKITITAFDENGVEGNPTIVNVVSKGALPAFENAQIIQAKETVDFVNGMEIHPESNSSFAVKINSDVGIKSVYSKISWGKAGVIENEVPLKNVTSYDFVLPILNDFPKGFINISVKATDVIDRVTEYKYSIYVTNTTLVKNIEPVLVFDDSRVAEDGSIINNKEFPATGYLLGANAISVELIPQTPFAKAELHGNQIRLVALNEIGASEPVIVRVITDKNKTVDSKPLVFKNDTALPTIKIERYSDSQAIDGRRGPVIIKGSVTCKTGVGNLKYRIMGAKTEIKNAVIASVKNDLVPEDLESIRLNENGEFELKLNTASFEPGMYVVEFIAESAGGNKDAKAVAISTIPEIVEVNGKLPAAKTQVISWFDGFNVYAVASYQGTLDRNFQTFSRKDMVEGNNPLVMTTQVQEKSPVTSKFTAVKNPTLNTNIAMINDLPYESGMTIPLTYLAKEGGKLTVYMDTGATIGSVSYEIYGDEIPGGDVTQTGSVKPIKPAEGETRWIAEIPLANLPVRVNNIKIKVKAGALEQEVKGSFRVVRQEASGQIDDEEKIYSFADVGTEYDKINEAFILKDGSKYMYYANLNGPLTVELSGGQDGLTVKKDDKFITLSSTKDGVYKNVKLVVKDRFGDVYESQPINFIADSTSPELKVLTPEIHQWLDGFVKISGTVADSIGVETVEYSLNNGETWHALQTNASDSARKGVTFNEEIDISNIHDGLIRLNVRATDNAEHVSEVLLSCFKDTTPPQITVIQPLKDDIVNGENLIVFNVEENGLFTKAEYHAPQMGETKGIVKDIPLNPLVHTHIGGKDYPIDDAMTFHFYDDAGNVGKIESWDFTIDSISDLPRTEIHVPEEMEVITRDFTISGVIYDDDGDTTIWYKIDDEEFRKLPKMGSSFSIDVPLKAMTDNEHTVTVYAVDINGVKGEEVTKTFRISLEEPKGAVLEPTIDNSVKEVVTISGVASDKNGIMKVEISLDNGNSYNDAVGTTDWAYSVDTRAIPGGTQVVFLKITDNYGITGLYSSLINIDNESPDVYLELPLDDSDSNGTLFFSGYSFDNVEVTDMYVSIRNLERTSDSIRYDLTKDKIIGQTIDISSLPDGFYNVELSCEDKAGNRTNVSRNIHLDKARPSALVDILYPLNGEHKNGIFNIYGQTEVQPGNEIASVKLYIDDKLVKETPLSDAGFFKFEITPPTEEKTGEVTEDGTELTRIRTDMTDGIHKYRVDAVMKNGIQISSREQTITYSSTGPWISIDNFTYGDFAMNRPYIKGRAGYSLSGDEILFAKSKEATKEQKAIIAAKKVAKIELSFDNGKTFTELSENEKWMYRVENQDMPEGYHFMLVRATMENGETAIERSIIQIDNTSPSVRLISPANGGRYNQVLSASGLSNDDVGLEKVEVTLRKGDKASYEVPAFIQGLYVDFHFWGATLFDIGAGLTFFDDNVKLQVQWGQFTQEQRNAVSTTLGIDMTNLRYGGDNILGMKILANIGSIPFSYFFGHDWEWLYAAFAMGAQFSMFNQTTSGESQILSALLGQVEFPRVQLQNVKMFSTFSTYFEGSLWFIPTDVSSEVKIDKVIPQFSVGLRVNIF